MHCALQGALSIAQKSLSGGSPAWQAAVGNVSGHTLLCAGSIGDYRESSMPHTRYRMGNKEGRAGSLNLDGVSFTDRHQPQN
jgi:hypothetical protein